MYLTRCQVNAAARGGQKLLASPHAMHAAVLSGFHAGQGDVGRVLWRVDRRQHEAWLYMVSPNRPDLTHLVEQAGWPTTQTWEAREYTPLLERLEQGQRWAFRLRANPVRSVREGRSRGKRVPHVTVEQQQEWLMQRAGTLGVALDTHAPVVSSRGDDVFQRGDGTVSLRWVVFDGILTVDDPDRLRSALVQGVGPAKGYGCGLLTLAPPASAAGAR